MIQACVSEEKLSFTKALFLQCSRVSNENEKVVYGVTAAYITLCLFQKSFEEDCFLFTKHCLRVFLFNSVLIMLENEAMVPN